MAFRRQAGGWQEYDYPVELVWRALTGNATGNLVDPLNEREYEGEPKPGTIYTRSLERVVNQRLAFEIKTHLYTTRWDVTLKSIDRCKTRVNVTLSADFTNSKSFLLCRMGFGLGGEIRYFLNDLDYKLRNVERKLKMK